MSIKDATYLAMNAIECAREQDVVDAVATGRWPDRCDDDLRAHVAACAICADVAEVARALQEERDLAWSDARVPPSGRVWWRAEMRARQEAARRAAQPITVVQGIAGACAAGLLVALIGMIWPRLWESLGLFAGLKALVGPGLASLSAALPGLGLPIAIALGASLVLTSVALYFVFSEK